MYKLNLGKIHWRFRYLFIAVFAAVLLGSLPARASMIVSIQSVIANSPSSGNAFDVTLTNSGPGSVTVGGFSFQLSVPAGFITFTSTTTATTLAPYIFAGFSLFGPTISTFPSGQSMDGSDLYSVIGAGATIAAGATVGLGHVFFDIAAGAPAGPVTVTLAGFPATSLSDPQGGDIPIGTLNNGTITVAGVPEPSTLMLALLGLPALLLVRKRLR